ncbi:MAG: SBBP repeat-containing protein [Rhodospirillales bacterium]|nr:SBBP repeat-containing protein [Rhodospirillales bacterium]
MVGVSGGGLSFIIKLDADGHFLWKRSIGGASSDQASGVACDEAGNAYVVGDTWFSGRRHTPYETAWAVKFDGDGHRLWKQTFVDPDADRDAAAVAADAEGNIVIVGRASTHYPYASWIARVNTDGQILWQNVFGIRTTVGDGYGVAVDTAGNAYVASRQLLNVGSHQDDFVVLDKYAP